MSAKVFEIPEIGVVNVYKRRGSRTMRLGFDSNGGLRLTMPSWVPFQTGIKFIQDKKDWILKHQPSASEPIQHGEKVGKAHRLILAAANVKTVQVRVKDNSVVVKFPENLSPNDPKILQAANRGARRALQIEAEKLLPQRLRLLASQNGFQHGTITVR